MLAQPPELTPKINKYGTPEYPVSSGADWDVFGQKSKVYTSILSTPGSMAEINLGENEEGITQYTWVKGERVISGEYSIDDVKSTAYGGKVIEADIHAVPSGYTEFPGSENLVPEPVSPYKEEWRTLIGTKIFGSPFESVPLSQDIYRKGEAGFEENIANKEKMNFQVQRLGDALSTEFASLTEESAGDQFYRGKRFQKDFYRGISNEQSLLNADAERVSSGTNRLSERQQRIANERIQRILNRDVTWQPTREDSLFAKSSPELPEGLSGMERIPSPSYTDEVISGIPEETPIKTGPIKITGKALMDIGLENLNNVKTVSGTDLGELSTGALPTGLLSEMKYSEGGYGPARTPQEWLDFKAGKGYKGFEEKGGVNPITGYHATPTERSLGKLQGGRIPKSTSFRTLSEAADQELGTFGKSTPDRISAWLKNNPGESLQPMPNVSARDIVPDIEDEFAVTPSVKSERITLRSPEPTAKGYNYGGVFGETGMLSATTRSSRNTPINQYGNPIPAASRVSAEFNIMFASTPAAKVSRSTIIAPELITKSTTSRVAPKYEINKLNRYDIGNSIASEFSSRQPITVSRVPRPVSRPSAFATDLSLFRGLRSPGAISPFDSVFGPSNPPSPVPTSPVPYPQKPPYSIFGLPSGASAPGGFLASNSKKSYNPFLEIIPLRSLLR
jgi:hypothetical protein